MPLVMKENWSSAHFCWEKEVEFRPPLYLKKHDFVTHHYIKLPQKTPNLEQIGCFFGQIFPKYTQFCKLGTAGLGQNPTNWYTKYDEKAPLSLWASQYIINQWETPSSDAIHILCFYLVGQICAGIYYRYALVSETNPLFLGLWGCMLQPFQKCDLSYQKVP